MSPRYFIFMRSQPISYNIHLRYRNTFYKQHAYTVLYRYINIYMHAIRTQFVVRRGRSWSCALGTSLRRTTNHSAVVAVTLSPMINPLTNTHDIISILRMMIRRILLRHFFQKQKHPLLQWLESVYPTDTYINRFMNILNAAKINKDDCLKSTHTPKLVQWNEIKFWQVPDRPLITSNIR